MPPSRPCPARSCSQPCRAPRPCACCPLVPRASASCRAPHAMPARAPHARPPARSARALLPAEPVCAPRACPAPPARACCAQRAVSWPCSVLYRNTAPALGLCCHNTIFFLYCDTIFLQPSCNTILQYYSSQPAIQTSVLQYKIFQPSLLYCNTMQPLQYNFPLGCNTIQRLLAIQSQPSNTTTFYFPQYDLGNSPSKSAPFFFHYNYYSYFFFLFPAAGKITKKIIFQFFFSFFFLYTQ